MYYRQTLTKLNCLNKSMMKPACPLPSSTTDKSERARERHRETETHRRGGNQFKVATHTHLNKIKNKPIYKM